MIQPPHKTEEKILVFLLFTQVIWLSIHHFTHTQSHTHDSFSSRRKKTTSFNRSKMANMSMLCLNDWERKTSCRLNSPQAWRTNKRGTKKPKQLTVTRRRAFTLIHKWYCRIGHVLLLPYFLHLVMTDLVFQGYSPFRIICTILRFVLINFLFFCVKLCSKPERKSVRARARARTGERGVTFIFELFFPFSLSLVRQRRCEWKAKGIFD